MSKASKEKETTRPRLQRPTLCDAILLQQVDLHDARSSVMHSPFDDQPLRQRQDQYKDQKDYRHRSGVARAEITESLGIHGIKDHFSRPIRTAVG